VGARHGSVWSATLAATPPQRAPLDGDLDCDVAIIGAGFTGLWTALSLARTDPSLRVVVVDRESVGFGASGRNGGWASALYPASFERVAATHGHDAMVALRDALRAGVVELGTTASDEGIECDYHRGGTVTLARSEVQAARLRAAASDANDDDVVWLDQAAAAARCNASDVLGATYTPHCAVIHPAKLVHGLAAAAERHGVRIFEHTAVALLQPAAGSRRACARGRFGALRADVVVRATEAYTAQLPRGAREIAPLYSLVVATEPLPASWFDRVGLQERETFCDGRHLIIYGQRTADDRLVFGGRGAPYHFRSRIEPRFDLEPRVFEKLEVTLVQLFGALPVPVSFRWGGPLGAPRDFTPAVRYSRERGLASAGGYVGDGVVLSHLAGRTLAALICGQDSELTSLPFVRHDTRAWEPEPLRWLGINAGLLTADLADRREAATRRPSRLARVLERLQGD
jgi:glycine/D-amino acid oxidase-like deaminating enzyme